MAKIAKNILIDDALPSNSADTDFFFNTSENIIYYRDRANYQWVPASSAQPGPQGPMGPQGPAGSDGAGLVIKGHKATASLLPTTGNSYNDAWIVDDSGNLYIWQGSSWFNAGKIVGFDGQDGATGPMGPMGPQGPAGQDADATALVTAHSDSITGIHGVSGNVVGTTDTQTLTNKTIDGTLNTLTVPATSVTGLTAALSSYAPLLLTINEQTASYIVQSSDLYKQIEMNVSTANTVTVPDDSIITIPVGGTILFVQTNTGQTSFVAGAGVTINFPTSLGLKMRARWATATLTKRAANTWLISGDISA